MPKLGSSKHPASVRVQSLARAEEVVSLCDQHGWKVVVGVEPGELEDLSDLERLLSGDTSDPEAVSAVRRENRVGRNEPCPCGSGSKYKRCCGKASGEAWAG